MSKPIYNTYDVAQINELIDQKNKYKKQAEDRKELLHQISVEVENFTGKFVKDDGKGGSKIDFKKILGLLTSLQFGGDPEKMKDKLGIDGMFQIKEKVDKVLAENE